MIHIQLNDNSFHIKGHAGQAESGRDIVCSAVSAISQTTLIGLKKYGNISERIKSGDLEIHFLTKDIVTNALYETMKQGLTQIAKQYPQYVTISKEEL